MGKWWFCGVMLAITATALSVIAGVTARPKTETPPPAAQNEVATAAETPFGTFGVYEGKLAFFGQDGTPQTVYDVWVNTLPEAERDKLQTGIPVPDRAAYLALLQEYTG